MKNCNRFDLDITGFGVTTAVGQGKTALALLQGSRAFGVMQRPGRQNGTSFLGAEIPSVSFLESFPKRKLRTASFTAHMLISTLPNQLPGTD